MKIEFGAMSLHLVLNLQLLMGLHFVYSMDSMMAYYSPLSYDELF